MAKKKYYSYKNGILQHDFDYNFIVGGRSNGKTTGYQLEVALPNYLNDKEQFVKIVRTNDDTVPLLNEDWIDVNVKNKLKNKGLTYVYYRKTFYIGLIKDYEDYGLKKFVQEKADVWGYVIPLSQQARYKSSDRSKVSTIVFDEFAIADEYMYLPNEVEQLMSLISTIIRSRDNVKVFFIGNALSLKNPYFDYFGIDASKLKSGNIYSFAQCGDEFKEYAKVGLDFVEMIYSNESDIPKLLRVSGNAQATTLDRYVLPNNIIKTNDWLYYCLKNKKFNDYYYIKNVIAWIRETDIDENNIDFDRLPKYDTVLEIVYKYDDNIRYLIKNSYDDSYGLMTQFETMKPNKKVGIDVRLKLPLYILDNKKYILGTTDLIDMIEECNIWKV
jgi:hypothetical protein|nr:MAG TPA: Terminase [Caudoviricetes sp.]